MERPIIFLPAIFLPFSLYVWNSYNDWMTAQVLGLDIGGANLKAAHTNGAARSIPFPLWKQPERLTANLAELCVAMPAYDCLAVTMTGELCDCFETKHHGVQAILHSVLALAGTMPIRVWCTNSRFLSVADALQDTARVAAANWLAEAHLVARRFPDERVLLIDTGSTTTDIVYLNRGTPEPHGLTDRARLASGELVYTGFRRTPLCAVLGMEVAAEFFATMLDAYLCAGLAPENAGDRATADGRPATIAYAQARLARMLCADVDTFGADDARALAERALHVQWHTVTDAMDRVLQGKPALDRIVVAGSGEVLGHSVSAGRVKSSLTDLLGAELSTAACAYAVALLASDADGMASCGR